MPVPNPSPMGAFFDLTATIGGRHQHAVVTEVAASLRSLTVDGVALIQEYPVDAEPPYCAGWVLVPWPNRVADGCWTYGGESLQLDITEPENHNAMHGLLSHSAYRIARRTQGSITLTADISAQPGYPFELKTSVHYELTEDGITVTHLLKNSGTRPAPVAVGAHPFLRLGTVATDELKLFIDADTHIEVDDRQNPTGTTTGVAGTRHDLRAGQTIGTVNLDDAWADVRRDRSGGSAHYLEAPDGRQVRLHMDASFGYVQAFTTKRFPTENGMVTAVAVEPMTAPPDAFNSGEGLRWLGPAQAWQLQWSIHFRH